MTDTKIIVLDDDPTGSQTVHSCLLLTRWDEATLKQALLDPSPIFFILTNTRGMDARRAAGVTREVCWKLHRALDDLSRSGQSVNALYVSRSDSTLRGHYPVETDVMAEELGGFDAHFLTPAFFEGGRITRNSTHYLMVDGQPVPTSETEFARDSVFGYSTSYLPDYVAEKTKGRVPADQVTRFLLDEIRSPDTDALVARLTALRGNVCCVVDAENQDDMNRFAAAVLAAVAKGKRFLFRSAASLLTALAKLPPQPVAAESMGQWVRDGHPGAVVMGSHVGKSTRQLQALLQEPDAVAVEVDVDRVQPERDGLLAEVLDEVRRLHARGATPVIYTSRQERTFSDEAARLAFGEAVSAFLMDVERGLPRTLGWLISKGGITSNDTLSQGLALAASRVLGQILPGVSVVRCPDDHPSFPGMPVVIFPGNVGGDDALRTAFLRLSRKEEVTTTQAKAA